MLRYLITGTGHSGTGYAAELLRRNGVECTHERYMCGEWQDVEAPAESSWMVARALASDPLIEYSRVLHLVRHPLMVLRSWHATRETRNDYARWMRETFPELNALDGLDRLIRRYLLWHDMIERDAPNGRRTVRTVPVESGPQAILWALGIGRTSDWHEPRINIKVENDDEPFWQWSDLPDTPDRWRLQHLADRYGYGAVDVEMERALREKKEEPAEEVADAPEVDP